MKKVLSVLLIAAVAAVCFISCSDSGIFESARTAEKITDESIHGILDVDITGTYPVITFNSQLNGVQKFTAYFQGKEVIVDGKTYSSYSDNPVSNAFGANQQAKVRGSFWYNFVAKVEDSYYARIYEDGSAGTNRSKIAQLNNNGSFAVDNTTVATTTLGGGIKFSYLTENGYALSATGNTCYSLNDKNTVPKEISNLSPSGLTITKLLPSTGSDSFLAYGYVTDTNDSKTYNYYVVKVTTETDETKGTATVCSYTYTDGTTGYISAACLATANSATYVLDESGYIYNSSDFSTALNKDTTSGETTTYNSIYNAKNPVTSGADFTGMFVTETSAGKVFWISTKENGIYKVTIDSENNVPTVSRVY